MILFTRSKTAYMKPLAVFAAALMLGASAFSDAALASTQYGDGATASGANSTAIGNNAQASGIGSTANGNGAKAEANASTANGSGATASGIYGTANGSNAIASGYQSTAVGSNSNALGANSVAIGSGSVAAGDNTVSFGSDTLKRSLTNIADGGVYSGSSDAVTGNQLWDAYQHMGTMENNIYREMDNLREDVNIVGAHAAALSGLHPIDYNPYEPTTLSAAIGTYRDEYAVAVGVFHYARENVMFNLGASLCSDGDLMGRAGVSFTVGKSPDKPKVAGTMNGLRNQVVTMQAKLDELEAEKKRDKETIARNAEALKKNEEIMKQNAELIRELTKKLEAQK